MKTIDVKDIIIKKLGKKVGDKEILIAELEATIIYLNQKLKTAQDDFQRYQEEVVEIPVQPQPIIQD